MEVEGNGDFLTFPMGSFFAILMVWLDFMKITTWPLLVVVMQE